MEKADISQQVHDTRNHRARVGSPFQGQPAFPTLSLAAGLFLADYAGTGRLALLAGALLFQSLPAWAEDGVATISVIAARSGDVHETINVVGTIVAREETLINVDLDGAVIDEVLAEAGDIVAQGQLLARLDSTKMQVELLRSDAQLQSAQAQVGQARSAIETAAATKRQAVANLTRSEKLSSKGAVSNEMLEQRQNDLARAAAAFGAAEQAFAAAQAAVSVAIAERKEIEVRLARTRILATTAGRVLTRSAKVGAIASSSSQPLFVIAKDGTLELEVEITQFQLSRLRAGVEARISVNDIPDTIYGQVRLLAPALAQGTRLGRARISLPAGIALPVGAFAKAEINAATNSGIVLPATSILESEGEPKVKIVDDNKVTQKSVSIGLRENGLVEIRSGVAAGELVVLKAGGFLTIGDQVNPFQVSYDLPATGPVASALSGDLQ